MGLLKKHLPYFILTLFFLTAVQAKTIHASPDDYDAITGEPKCTKCHTPDRKYSIDYTREGSCSECHGAGLSDNYLAINERFREGADHAEVAQRGPAARTPSSGQKEMDMVLVPGGEFTMGSDSWWPKSQPEHKAKLPPFYIDKYEVTNRRYKTFADATGRTPPDHWAGGRIPEGREDHPVTFVNWHDADAFCRWEGKRLPTEAEWEKAARGVDKRTFPWGDKFAKEKANTPQLGLEDTVPVGSFPEGASPYGVHDMAGNVFEWMADWFKPYPGNTHPDENYGERYKVVRGGSWYDCTYYKCGISSPTYNRIFFHPNTRNNNFGFRCVKDR